MAGNAITDPQNQYIGTSDSIAVVFRTNNIEALRLAANKNIGMGVNEPTAKLDIAETVRVRENLLVDSLAFTPDQNNPASLRTLLVGPDGKISLSRSGITDTTLFPLMASVEVLDSASAKGIKGGEAAVTVSGGMPPYRIEWNNGERTDTAHFLRAGNQKVLVFDANGLKKELALEVPQIAPLSLTLVSDTFPNGKNISCFDCKDGVIQSLVSGGRAPYLYKWLPGEIEDSTSLHARGTGLYVLQISDVTGETATAWISLSAPERPDWQMSGNAETDPENQFIGTSDSTDVVFRTNNIEALRVAANNNIGIGVTEPLARMDVGGTFRVRGNARLDSLAFTPDSLDPGQFRIIVSDTEGNLRIVDPTLPYYEHPGGGGPIENTPGIGCIGVPAFWHNPLTAQPSLTTCKYVGISTNEPRTNLDVIGTTYSDKLQIGTLDLQSNYTVLVNGHSSFTGKTHLNLGENEEFFINDVKTGIGYTMNIQVKDGNQKVLGIYNDDLDEEVFLVMPNGDTRIGAVDEGNGDYTTSKLKVYGRISARKMFVTQSAFPDYVFQPTHVRMTLEELENYIKRYGHLPGMPSECEVSEEGGFELGEIQVKTLEKTEELFLYLIEMEKKIKQMQTELVQFKSQTQK